MAGAAPLSYVRQLYPAVADPDGDAKQRAKETRRLQQLANILRSTGLGEDDNPASSYLRACGVKRHAPRIETLRRIGLPVEFLCSPEIIKVPEAARVLSLLVEHSGKHPDHLGTDDVEAFLARPRDSLVRGTRPAQRERYLLKRAFRLYYAFSGRKTPNPVATRPWVPRIDRSGFPGA